MGNAQCHSKSQEPLALRPGLHFRQSSSQSFSDRCITVRLYPRYPSVMLYLCSTTAPTRDPAPQSCLFPVARRAAAPAGQSERGGAPTVPHFATPKRAASRLPVSFAQRARTRTSLPGRTLFSRLPTPHSGLSFPDPSRHDFTLSSTVRHANCSIPEKVLLEYPSPPFSVA